MQEGEGGDCPEGNERSNSSLYIRLILRKSFHGWNSTRLQIIRLSTIFCPKLRRLQFRRNRTNDYLNGCRWPLTFMTCSHSTETNALFGQALPTCDLSALVIRLLLNERLMIMIYWLVIGAWGKVANYTEVIRHTWICVLVRCTVKIRIIIIIIIRRRPNIGFTLRRVLAVFTRSAITLPKVNRFGWNLEHYEYIVGGWPWQILGEICAVATAGEPSEVR